MARLSVVALAFLMVAPLPLVAIPTAAATHVETSTTHDICVLSKSQPPTLTVGGGAPMPFADVGGPGTACRTGRGVVESAAKNYTLTGEAAGPPTVLKIGDVVTFAVFFDAGDAYRCGGGFDATDVPATSPSPGQTTDVRVTIHDGESIGLFGTPLLASSPGQPPAFAQVSAIVAAQPGIVEPPAGVRSVSLLLTASVVCMVAGNDVSVDKDWTVTLNDILVDNTPPDAMASITPNVIAGFNNVARIGDTVDLHLSVTDPDFQASPEICERYEFISPIDLLSSSSRVQSGAVFRNGPFCSAGTAVAGIPVTAQTLLGYDFDSAAVVTQPNVARIVSVGVNDTMIPSSSANLWLYALDEHGNSARVYITPVRVDAVAPQAPEFTLATRPNARVEITVPVSRISTDVLRFDIERCYPQAGPCTATSATWTSVASSTRIPTSPPAAWTFVTPQLIYDPSISIVVLRILAFDDAGNPSPSAYSDPVTLDPTVPAFGPLTSSGGRPVADGDQDPLDRLGFWVYDNKMADPPSFSLSNGVAFARLWRQSPSGIDEYWTSAGVWSNTPGPSANLAVRKASSEPGPSPGYISAGHFHFEPGALNACAAPWEPASCIPTGSYRLNFFARDADGNLACMFPANGGCCVEPMPAQCTGGITLARDQKDPTFSLPPSTDYKGAPFNRIASFPDLPGQPGADLSAVQQGTFLPVSLKVADEGSGFRNITFRFMTGPNFDRVANSTLGGHAIACMRTFNATPTDPEPKALARVPRLAADCALVPSAATYADPFAVPSSIVCSGSPRLCVFETAHCYTPGPPQSCSGGLFGGQTRVRTPYVNVSTDGVPLGTYKLQVTATDWALRTTRLTLPQTFTVVPRVVVDASVAVVRDDRISMIVDAAVTDARAECPVEAVTVQTIASLTATCTVDAVRVEYVPPGGAPAESNLRLLAEFGPPLSGPLVPDLARFIYAPYGRVEDPVRFFRYALEDFPIPEGATLPDPPVVRVSVTAHTLAGTLSVSRTWVTLQGSVSQDRPADLSPEAVTVAPAFPREGDVVTLHGLVRNIGSGSAAASQVAAYRFDAFGARTFVADVQMPPLAAGEAAEFALHLSGLGEGMRFEGLLVVDPAFEVAEANEFNNEADVSFGVGPRAVVDLIAGTFDIVSEEVVAGRHHTFRTSIRNDGTVGAAFDVAWELVDGDALSTTVLRERRFVDANETVPASLTFVAPAAGGHTLRLLLDPDGQVSEVSESENVATIAFVSLPPPADLAVHIRSVEKESLRTDAAEAAFPVGRYVVMVEACNAGGRPLLGGLELVAEAATRGIDARTNGRGDDAPVDLDAGECETVRLTWDPIGAVGDVELIVVGSASQNEFSENDTDRVSGFVLFGGLGGVIIA